MISQLTSADFEQKALKVDEPVLVDFFATWCGPCKMMHPVLEELAQDVTGRASVYQVDVDQSPELAQRYGVMSVPTLIVFKSGAISDQFVGVQPKAVLSEALL